MRAEFFRPESPDETVASARWDGRAAIVEAADEETKALIERVFRPSAVAVDDSALRPRGAHGETVVEPGDLEWFRSAAAIRGEREGLSVRFASTAPGGWEPAGAYRPFGRWIARKESPDSPSL